LQIPLKEGLGGESRGDRGETQGDSINNSIVIAKLLKNRETKRKDY
jgi:hypothetical protein